MWLKPQSSIDSFPLAEANGNLTKSLITVRFSGRKIKATEEGFSHIQHIPKKIRNKLSQK